MASPRQRAARWRYVQYAVLVVVLLAIALIADWAAAPAGVLELGAGQGAVPRRPDDRAQEHASSTPRAASPSAWSLGLVLALMRLSVVAPYRWVANVYIEFFRGIPLLLWLFFLGYGVLDQG